jgi:hypothetical protein
MTEIRYGHPEERPFGIIKASRQNAVIYDMWCGEPVAWAVSGETVKLSPWPGPDVPYTQALTTSDAIGKYGPLAWVVTGPGGGFEMARYGDTCFIVRWLDPRAPWPPGSGTGFDPPVTWVNDPVIARYACPRCDAAAGAPCSDPKGVQRHMARVKAARA